MEGAKPITDMDAAYGSKAGEAKTSGKFRNPADAVFVDEEGP